MIFNPDISKQTQEVAFSRKTDKVNHISLTFNAIPVAQTSHQKHLGLYLDDKLNFSHHIKEIISKLNKHCVKIVQIRTYFWSVFSYIQTEYGSEITPYFDTFHAVKEIGIIKKLRNILPRHALLTVYKASIRPNIYYCDFIYDRPHNENFCNNIEMFQYNAALAVTGATKRTSKLKIYEELCLESLKFRRWLHRLCVVYKIKTGGHPEYLYKLIPTKSSFYNTRNSHHIKTYCCRTDIFKYSFFPYLNVEWNKLDHTLRNSKYYNIFKSSLLKIGRPIPKPTFNIHNPLGLKLFTRLSHLNENRFNHNFED